MTKCFQISYRIVEILTNECICTIQSIPSSKYSQGSEKLKQKSLQRYCFQRRVSTSTRFFLIFFFRSLPRRRRFERKFGSLSSQRDERNDRTIDRDISSIHKIYKDFNKVSLHRTLLFLRSLVIVGLNYILLTRDELIRPLRKKIQQLVVIHAVQRLYVYAERVRNALHVETEALQQLDEVHFLTGERVVQLRAAVITLRPSAAFD